MLNAIGEVLRSTEEESDREHLFGLAERVLDKEQEQYNELDTVSFEDL